MNYKLALGISAFMLMPALADEADLLDHAERVAYCIAPKTAEREFSRPFEKIYEEDGEELDRMRAFVNSVIVDKISTPSPWPAAIATAAESGRRDSTMCQQTINAELNAPDSPRIGACMASNPNDTPGLIQCLQASSPAECKRSAARCADVDSLLPF